MAKANYVRISGRLAAALAATALAATAPIWLADRGGRGESDMTARGLAHPNRAVLGSGATGLGLGRGAGPSLGRGGGPGLGGGAHSDDGSAADQPAQATSAPHGRPVQVSVALSHPGATVPTGFLGMSFEASALPRIAAYATEGDQLARLLRSLGGDGVLRFGGVSADEGVAWSQSGVPPRWASVAIGPHDLAGLRTLARQTGWSVLLTVNLGHYDPAAAAREAAAARALLGGRLAGVEIGNEPDRFYREGLRGPGWTFSAYRHEWDAYRAAIARAAPGVPIVGPDASSGVPVLPWVREAAALRPDLLSDHYYPLTSCGSTPTVDELLSPSVRADETSMLDSLAAIQRSSAIPLQVDETNNISCKGQPGVSDAFASALWAADYIPRAMAAGLRGLDFHDLLSVPHAYSPLVIARGGLHANPEWYALLLTAPLQGDRLLRTAVGGVSSSSSSSSYPSSHSSSSSSSSYSSSYPSHYSYPSHSYYSSSSSYPSYYPSSSDLTASAFTSPANGAIRLVLVDFDPPGASPLRVKLQVPGRFARGTILRLTAPSPYAISGVRLDGSQVGPSGVWSAHSPLPSVYDGASSPELAMEPSSAALVTLYPASSPMR